MDQAIQTLLDKQAIYELSCRYMRGLDRLDADALVSVFWEDAPDGRGLNYRDLYPQAPPPGMVR
mgnify:CR=1 FL=1